MHKHTSLTPLHGLFLLGIFLTSVASGMGIGNVVVQGGERYLASDISTASGAAIRAQFREEQKRKAFLRAKEAQKPKPRVLKKKKVIEKKYIRKGIPKTGIQRTTRRNGSGEIIEYASSAPRTLKTSVCGDTLRLFAEECDDGNTRTKDGCDASCKVETGYVCNSAQPSTCWSTCGDGKVGLGNETCDDGNLTNGDGCNSVCRVEVLYKCTGSPSVCAIPAYCGNAVVEGSEACDDGNSTPYDGCSSTCEIQLPSSS